MKHFTIYEVSSMKHKENAPTMKDVAREAGVALGTVSKVFNNIPVGEDYRRRVEEAAKRLGYQVNSYARGLKTNRTCSAALILPNVTAPFFARRSARRWPRGAIGPSCLLPPTTRRRSSGVSGWSSKTR